MFHLGLRTDTARALDAARIATYRDPHWTCRAAS
jgi:hypothetical protein